MGEMLRRIHAVVGELMYAENFFIVLHNAERETLRFIYFADEQTPAWSTRRRRSRPSRWLRA